MTKAAERNRRYRDKLRGGPPRQLKGFWERVQKSDGCWLWTGHRNPQGYGTVWFQGNSWRAHRLAWHLTVGGVPAVQDVLHRCDNPACVRPDHLFLGVDADNAADREAKGRGNHHDGHSRSKLTTADARFIRQNYEPYSRVTGRLALAKRFGVHPSRIVAVVADKAWKCSA